MIPNGKRASIAPFPFLVGVFGIVVLLTVLSLLLVGYSDIKKFHKEPLGGKALELFETYQRTDEALLYLDSAAKVAMQTATYQFAKNGFYPAPASSCGGAAVEEHVLWSRGTAHPTGGSRCEAQLALCIPSDQGAFKHYFRTDLYTHLKTYNDRLEEKEEERVFPDIPNNYEDLRLGTAEDRIEVVGIASQPLVFTDKNKERLTYTAMPSFRETGDVNLLADFTSITKAAREVAGSTRAAITLKVNELNMAGPLQWEAKYRTTPRLSCYTGQRCIVRYEERNIDPGCKIGCATESVPIYGDLIHFYSENTAFFDVSIPDEAYGENRKFVTESEEGNPENQEYVYRFALHWVEMGSVECVE